MVAIKNIILLISAVSAVAISKRDSVTLTNDIANISTNTNALTAAVNNNKGIANLVPLIAAQTNLENSITTATADANVISALSEKDSNNILTEFKALGPDTIAALNAIVKNKPTFDLEGVTPIVKSGVLSSQAASASLGTAVVDISSPDVKPNLTEINTNIAAAFASALAAL
ncbi:hypothetical protein NHQ30_009663 [Ciborinia camelliae]|nr:hypothetical protein NHQ30_009663 [Ciborinia camelliae]